MDAIGGSNTTYLQNSLNSLIALKVAEPARRAQGYTPTLVAVNMSVTIPGQIYSGSCSGIQIGSQIQTLLNDGVVVVVAAGNDGSESGVTAPACYPGVISVGATYDSSTIFKGCGTNNHHADTVACFSDYNSIYPSVYAPGVNIGASDTYIDGIPQSGTSMAAPHVAGEVAILRQVPAGAAKSVASLGLTIIANGTPVSDGSGTNKNRVDISKAISALSPAPVAANAIVLSGMLLKTGSTSSAAYYCTALSGATVACPSNAAAIWTSSNPAVATVSAGVVHGVGVGAATISVHNPLVTNPDAQMTVQVSAALVLTKITWTPSSLSETVGQASTVETFKGYDQNGGVFGLSPDTLASANPAVATVHNLNGVTTITGIAVGTTTVTVGESGVTGTLNVTITAKPGVGPPNCTTNPQSCAITTPGPAIKH